MKMEQVRWPITLAKHASSRGVPRCSLHMGVLARRKVGKRKHEAGGRKHCSVPILVSCDALPPCAGGEQPEGAGRAATGLVPGWRKSNSRCRVGKIKPACRIATLPCAGSGAVTATEAPAGGVDDTAAAQPSSRSAAWLPQSSGSETAEHPPQQRRMLGFNLSELDYRILSLAVPAVAALAADPLLSLIDTAFVGHLSSDALVSHFCWREPRGERGWYAYGECLCVCTEEGWRPQVQ